MNNCKDDINDEEKIDEDSDKPPSINSTTSSTGSIKCYSGDKNKSKSIEDFEILYGLGKGSFGKVVLGQHIYSHQLYAIKYVSKRFIEKVKSS
jgi:hypothetical protein